MNEDKLTLIENISKVLAKSEDHMRALIIDWGSTYVSMGSLRAAEKACKEAESEDLDKTLKLLETGGLVLGLTYDRMCNGLELWEELMYQSLLTAHAADNKDNQKGMEASRKFVEASDKLEKLVSE